MSEPLTREQVLRRLSKVLVIDREELAAHDAALRARIEEVERERDIYKTIAADNCRHADDRLNVIEEMATEVADLTAKCEELERDVDMAHDCLQQSGEYVADLTARLAAAPPITAQEARPGEPGATWYETKGTS